MGFPQRQGAQTMKRYAYAWITLALFVISFVGHWWLGWHAYANEAQAHGEAPSVAQWLVLMGRDTFENWQSEFLQLLWQVCGLAFFYFIGSPASKEGNNRMEQKLDELMKERNLWDEIARIDREGMRK
jgi:hypothetical protein